MIYVPSGAPTNFSGPNDSCSPRLTYANRTWTLLPQQNGLHYNDLCYIRWRNFTPNILVHNPFVVGLRVERPDSQMVEVSKILAK